MPRVDPRVQALDANARDRFFELSTCSSFQHEPRELGIFLTNAMRTSGASSVFGQVSRINHSCCPNVHHSWNELHGELTLHAACDIEEGTELSICYIPLAVARGVPRQVRQERLRANFGFWCECEMCGGPAPVHVDVG